ncbi:hypothetical protein J3R30DRAFT_3537502 [Lentinula aciculospora]|uniref:Uncharacterized protein n=1 Tax=Lentinula aciculospora TaxID=153920 RepID=A0A9W8ZZP4_9AGAR|nr:hypothetical protein J3R30DRAFT_3537502 [Lentinula aciculospora]
MATTQVTTTPLMLISLYFVSSIPTSVFTSYPSYYFKYTLREAKEDGQIQRQRERRREDEVQISRLQFGRQICINHGLFRWTGRDRVLTDPLSWVLHRLWT